jgi:hypothetical protein
MTPPIPSTPVRDSQPRVGRSQVELDSRWEEMTENRRRFDEPRKDRPARKTTKTFRDCLKSRS